MKRKHSNITGQNGAPDDQEFSLLMNQLPDPDPAGIASSVMLKIRQRRVEPIRIRRREVVWGFAGGLAGLLLGFWFASASIDKSQNTFAEQYEEVITGLEDELDLFAWEIGQPDMEGVQ